MKTTNEYRGTAIETIAGMQFQVSGTLDNDYREVQEWVKEHLECDPSYIIEIECRVDDPKNRDNDRGIWQLWKRIANNQVTTFDAYGKIQSVRDYILS